MGQLCTEVDSVQYFVVFSFSHVEYFTKQIMYPTNFKTFQICSKIFIKSFYCRQKKCDQKRFELIQLHALCWLYFESQSNIFHTSLMPREIDFNSLAAFTLQPNPIFPIYHCRKTAAGEQVLHKVKFHI